MIKQMLDLGKQNTDAMSSDGGFAAELRGPEESFDRETEWEPSIEKSYQIISLFCFRLLLFHN